MKDPLDGFHGVSCGECGNLYFKKNEPEQPKKLWEKLFTAYSSGDLTEEPQEDSFKYVAKASLKHFEEIIEKFYIGYSQSLKEELLKAMRESV